MPQPQRLIALLLGSVLVLAGCSGDEAATPAEDPTTSTAGSSSTPESVEEPYLEVPEGVELTAPGSTLAVGDTATVAYELEEEGVGALDIRVTAMEKASFKMFDGWELTKATRKTQPYFVRARVRNVGDTDLGGRPVPLYIVDGENRLIESSIFTGTFKPCQGSSFPKKFKPGAKRKACMVYLSPDRGELTAVSFRPSQEFNPIIWEGEVEPAGGNEKKQQKKKTKKNNNDG